MSGRFQQELQQIINGLKSHIQKLRQLIDRSEHLYDTCVDFQTELDEDVAKGEISDGEYLISSNKNLARIRGIEEGLKESSRDLKTALIEHKEAVRYKACGGEDSDSE